VWVAIRPEKINLSRERPPPASENVAQGVVKEIAYMGDMSIYLVQIESGKTIRVTIPNVARHADDRITWDETVYLSWHAAGPVVLTR
jgi:putrescine transport system ATP-binding protein